MSESQPARRAVAEIRAGENQMAGARIGNRSIHQFWYLFSPYFRHVLLAPHRRPDSDRVTWSWQEAAEAKPPTVPELAEVRRRLTDANRALAADLVDLGSSEGSEGGSAQSLDAQVRKNLQEMITSLCAKPDHALGGYVCRTPTGLMLHSWSASTPSVPYYPDSRQGGIKGTVWLDGQAAAGVTVVLQNKQGADLDHATSGRTGAFGFQNVAPGQYRVRVAGRDDFPAEGLAVTVGHEAVGGLELRGGSSGPTGAQGASSAGFPSGHKRRWLAGLALLTLLGAGGLVWRYITKPAASPTVGGKAPFAWQSASGKLAGPIEQAPADDAHKAGGAGSWSDLSRTISPPKALKTPRFREAKANPSDDRSSAPSATELAAVPSLRVPEEESPSGDSTDKNRLPRSDAKQPRGSDRVGPSAMEPTAPDAVPADDVAQDEPDGAGARPPENKTSDLAPALAAKKRQTVPNSSLPSVDNPSSEAALSGGAQLTQTESFSAIPKAESPSARIAQPTGSKGSGAADQSQASAAAAESGMPAEAAPGSGAGSTDHVQARAGTKPKERAGLARATATTATIRTASTGEEAKENEEPAPPETGNGQVSSESPARASLPVVRPSETPSSSAEKTLPGDQTDSEAKSAPDAPAAAKEPAKSATPAGRSASAPAASMPARANPAEPGGTPTTEPAASPSGSDANSAARSARPGRKNPSFPTAGQVTTEKEMPASGMAPSSARALDDERGDGQWVSLGRVSASAWQSRLVRDLVLPTQPVPEGEDDALETMQANLLRERKKLMPPTFQQPATTSGLAFEFPSGETGPRRPLRWRNAAGAEVAGSMVDGNRAELAWAGTNAPRGIDYVLGDAAGREIVRVSLDQTGASKITTRSGVRTWYWVGIEHAPADATALLSGQAEPRLSWRLLAGAADASGWPRDNRWRAGRGQRIDLPLGPTGVGQGSFTLALVDPVTGWAIECNITLR